MGIPLYFHKITNHFKSVVSPHNPERCDRLFLDFNGVVHNCAREVRMRANATTVSKDEFEALLIKDVIAYTESLCDYARPRELLCICIDGVAPLAKIQQQRKRRYLSAWLKSKVKEEGYPWDTNAISPGTPFMHKLNAALKRFVTEKNALSDGRSAPKYRLSDSTEHGEGEHKIFDLIASIAHTESCVDVIYGLDADLIMLSMLCRRTKKFLMREPQNFSSTPNPTNAPFLWFDVDACRSMVLDYYGDSVDIESYVILCALIGNDFLPTLTYLTIFNNGVDAIMAAYKIVLESGCGPVVYYEDGRYTLNSTTLSLLLNQLKCAEDDECKKLHDKYHNKTMVLHTHKQKIENYGITHKNVSTKTMFRSNNWRSNYYLHLFDMNIYKDSVIASCCQQYVNGILWMVEYYLNKRTSNAWCYTYNYSPTILDLYNYLEVNKKELGNVVVDSMFVDNDTSIDEDTQLLMIMPAGSFGVLPLKLQRMLSTNVTVRYYYPKTFKIETYLKSKLHECYPILPQFESCNDLIRCAT